MAKRPDLKALFLKGSKLISENVHESYSISYHEIFLSAEKLILEKDFKAADALHTVYTEITGHSHLKYSGTNLKLYGVYKRADAYIPIAEKLLTKLEKIFNANELKKEREAKFAEVYADTVQPEIDRGADEEDLRDIGILH